MVSKNEGANVRYLSVGSHQIDFGSAGISTNEDSKSNSINGAFKKSDASSYTLISEFQTTKNSNEQLQEYQNSKKYNTRIGDVNDKRKLFQSSNPIKRSTEFTQTINNPCGQAQDSVFVLPSIQTSRKFTQSNIVTEGAIIGGLQIVKPSIEHLESLQP